MENKNKLLFLFIGIMIGALTVLAGTYLFNNGMTKENKVILKDSQGVTEIKYSERNETNKNNYEEIVKLNDAEIKELGIVIDKVGSQKIRLYRDLTGKVVPDPYKLAHIVPRFSGIVKNVYKEMGDRIKRDEVIAVIESNESLVTYDVKSSIEGVVLELHMTPGELIGDDKHVVTIADLRSVWADLNVYQKDLKKIKVGQNAQVYFDDIENAVTGKIFYLSPTVDEHTRTATARVRLNNKSGYWKPGMFITAKVLTEYLNVGHAGTLNAIQNFEGQKVVFVKEGEGFRPQPVTLGKTNTKYVEILSGLSEGEEYIAKGAFTVKAELLKASFGGGHGD